MKNSINEAMKGLLNATLCEIEKKFDGDVLNYYGPIIDGNENALCDIIEELEENGHRKATLIVILTTTGGSATAVERYVNIIRKHFSKPLGTFYCFTIL